MNVILFPPFVHPAHSFLQPVKLEIIVKITGDLTRSKSDLEPSSNYITYWKPIQVIQTLC